MIYLLTLLTLLSLGILVVLFLKNAELKGQTCLIIEIVLTSA